MRRRGTPWLRCNPACVQFLKVKPDFQGCRRGLVRFNATRKTPHRQPSAKRREKADG